MQGGSFLGTSRGGFDVGKIADAIQYRGLNQVCATATSARVPSNCQNQTPDARKSHPSTHYAAVPSVSLKHSIRTKATYTQVYIIGGDGAHRGAQTIFDEVVVRRRLKVAIGEWLAR